MLTFSVLKVNVTRRMPIGRCGDDGESLQMR